MLVPCQLCGDACTGACKMCRQCTLCDRITDFLCPRDGVNRVFSCYASVIGATAIFFAAQGLALKGDCGANTWFAQAIACGAGNIGFALWLHCRFTERLKKDRADGRLGDRVGCCKACSETVDFIAWDVGVFFYLVFVVYVLYWCISAETHSGGGRDAGGPFSCSEKSDALGNIKCLWGLYFFTGPCLACFAIGHAISNPPPPDAAPMAPGGQKQTYQYGTPQVQQYPAAGAGYQRQQQQQHQQVYPAATAPTAGGQPQWGATAPTAGGQPQWGAPPTKRVVE